MIDVKRYTCAGQKGMIPSAIGTFVSVEDYEAAIRERDEARRLLDDARVTLVGIAGATARALELPRNEFIDEFLPWAQSRARDAAAKIAAPVPAQPAVPDFIPALYSWLARAHFDRQQDEVTASRFGQQLHAWITAQPAAVPEAVAKDAAKEIVWLIVRDLCETEPANPDDPDSVCVSADELRVIVSRHVIGEDAAILSAADTEVKKDA